MLGALQTKPLQRLLLNFKDMYMSDGFIRGSTYYLKLLQLFHILFCSAQTMTHVSLGAVLTRHQGTSAWLAPRVTRVTLGMDCHTLHITGYSSVMDRPVLH